MGKQSKYIKVIKQLPLIVSILAVLAVVYYLGFFHQPLEQEVLHWIFLSAICVSGIAIVARYFFRSMRPKWRILPYDILLILLIVLVFLQVDIFFGDRFIFSQILPRRFFLFLAILLGFIREFSTGIFDFRRMIFNPAQLFILSFLVIILVGGGLLLLPNATHTGISGIDAMFTSTSAVCVTGLVVVDTGSFFTEFGHYIILILIQLGGIGIMTFTSYFSYFFKAGSSYENQLLLSSMTNTEKIGEVFVTLKKIIFITFIVEGIGALIIFQSIDVEVIPSFLDRVFFSVFHSVSGFCNAGFSTLGNGFYEPAFRFNYPLHLIIALLIILGGIGFPIVFNLLKYIKNYFRNVWLIVLGKRSQIHLPRIINVHTRIVLITSLILTVAGTLLFFVFEYNNTLSEHSFVGKIVTSFFGSVTTRTAGFNTVDTSSLSILTVMLVVFLMWVGASPGSTGGGIKTSTFAIAILNFIALARGKQKIEVFRREIAQNSVNRAFAIIFLSILVIFVSIFFISLFDIEKGLTNISFECVSAFGTVGLSRGITAELSNPSKFVLILTMFAGRVSMLTILIAVFKKMAHHKYHFPTEEVLIN
ncbi:MAG: ATPase [Bacteroidetes bacterium]|nr:ATPase [Bacteroidota bacterium]MBU1719165.1 ATPase [Bacteroidota bacterium]